MKPVNLKFKGLGSYFGESEINFGSLDDVFLICGETGSGKTTILDAMMFALYGESSGGERSELLNGHYTKKDGEAYSVFEFELSGKRYRFSRTFTPKARAEGWNEYQDCAYYDTEKEMWQPYFDNPRQKDVNAQAVKLLGLTAEQFRQVVILPQGKFERLLTCPTKEKEELLRTLFGAERFTRISERLKKLADDEKKSIECEQMKIDADLSAAKLDSPEAADAQVSEYKAALEEMKSAHAAANAEKKRADEVLSAGSLLAEKFAELDKSEKSLAMLKEKQPEFDRLAEKIDRLEREKAVLHETDNYCAAREEHLRRSKAISDAKAALTAADADNIAAQKRLQEHKNDEQENISRREEYIRLEGLRSVYAAAEPLRSETEKALILGKKLRTEYDNAGKKAADLKAAADKKSKEAQEKEKYADSVLRLYNELKALEDAKKSRSEADRLNKEKAELSVRADTLACRIKQAEEQEKNYQAEYENVRKAFIDGISSRLAAELAEGTPCPVCGSTHHPEKHSGVQTVSDSDMEAAEKKLRQVTEEKIKLTSDQIAAVQKISELDEQIKALEAIIPRGYSEENYINAKAAYDNAYKEQQKLPQLREELRELNAQLDRAEQENKIISEKLIEARENYSSLAAQYKSACAQMEKDIHDTSALEKRLAELKRLTDEYSLVSEKLSQEVSLCAQKLAAASTSHETALGEEKAAVQKLAMAKEAAEKVLEENNLPPADEFVPDRENISRLPELSERLKQFVSALSDAAKRQEELSGELSGKERPDIAALKNLRDSADAKCSELDFNIRSTEENIKRLTDLAADCRKRMEALNARREIYAQQREFADMMSGAKGISFTRYVLGVMLDMVTDEANNMLANMLDGTFRLVRSKEVGGGSKQGLDLMVESALAEHSASYPTAQLSGGEKFLISLVLGVALSTVVQSRFGGISIDAMFIDEGFGSLDPAALADAVKVIYTIQGSRRKVGIISHVDKLKEEIPCCINVKKDRHGSSLSY